MWETAFPPGLATKTHTFSSTGSGTSSLSVEFRWALELVGQKPAVQPAHSSSPGYFLC